MPWSSFEYEIKVNKSNFKYANTFFRQQSNKICDDGDGIANVFDLDSDNDGCYDSYETGVTGATADGSGSDSLAIVTTDTTGVGANGFANTLETNGDGVYTGTYTYANAIDMISACSMPEIIAVQDTLTIIEDMMATITVLPNDTIRDSKIDTAGMQIYTKPTSGSTATFNPDGTIAYIPAMDFNGMDTIEYIVCDTTSAPNTLCDTAMVIITVDLVNDTPSIVQPPIVVPEDSMLTFCPTIMDADIGDYNK